jgi:curli biogenesis system outer membrane secretion channel CsgG
MFRQSLASALAVGAALVASYGAANAVQSAGQQTSQAINDVPRCARPIGNLAVNEPQERWWTQYRLGSPEALIKVFVSRSNCFRLVDRGSGFEAAQRERALAAGGDLRVGSNIGQGQVLAADYILVPDIVSSNNNAGGLNVGGLLGGFIGGPVGSLVGGINLQRKTADVVLTVTDVRSSAQLATIDGHSNRTNLGFAAGGGIFGGGGFGAAGASGYDNTEVGQLITTAYLEAYSKLVDQMGGEIAANGGSANSPGQAVQMTRPGNMYTTSSTRSQVVRPLDPGMKLYPTGNKDGLMWEVQDELGNKGWVTSIAFELAK